MNTTTLVLLVVLGVFLVLYIARRNSPSQPGRLSCANSREGNVRCARRHAARRVRCPAGRVRRAAVQSASDATTAAAPDGAGLTLGVHAEGAAPERQRPAAERERRRGDARSP